MSRIQKLGQGLLAALLGLIAACLLAEGFLRFIYDPLEAPPAAPPNWEASAALYEPDPVLEYRLRPNAAIPFTRQSDGAQIAVRTNNLGFRDEADYVTGPHEGRRVLLLGDSLVFGAGVPFEQTIGEYLEAARPSTEVMAWGIPGYGQEQERRLLEELDAPAFQPDVVLVAITTSNDFGKTLNISTLQEVAGILAEPASPQTTAPVDDAPVSLAERIKRPLRSLRTYRLLAVYGNRFLGMLGRREVAVSQAAIESTRSDLEALMAYAEAHDLRLAFVLIPPRAFARPMEEMYAYEREVYTYYGDTLESLGADWLDLEPALIDGAARQDPDAIYWDDVHLTAEGNRLAAEAMAAFIADLLETDRKSTRLNSS